MVCRSAECKGFTLIEIVVATAIIAIMAGVLLPLSFKAINYQKKLETEQAIDKILDALKHYYADNNQFPAGNNQNGLIDLLDDDGSPEWNGPYLTLSRMITIAGDNTWDDFWGSNIIYRRNGTQCMVLCYGPDRGNDSSWNNPSNNWTNSAWAVLTDDLGGKLSGSVLQLSASSTARKIQDTQTAVIDITTAYNDPTYQNGTPLDPNGNEVNTLIDIRADLGGGPVIIDSWGNYFRWGGGQFYSIGPNGIDNNRGGDDIT